jgi:hypothetical protein
MIDRNLTARPFYSCNVISKRNETMVLDSPVAGKEGAMTKLQPVLAELNHDVAELAFTATSVFFAILPTLILLSSFIVAVIILQ